MTGSNFRRGFNPYSSTLVAASPSSTAFAFLFAQLAFAWALFTGSTILPRALGTSPAVDGPAMGAGSVDGARLAPRLVTGAEGARLIVAAFFGSLAGGSSS